MLVPKPDKPQKTVPKGGIGPDTRRKGVASQQVECIEFDAASEASEGFEIGSVGA